MSIPRETILRSAAYGMLVLLPACARAPAPRPVATANAGTRAAIESRSSKLFDAYRRRDGAAFAAFYSADAEMDAPGMTMRGRPAIQADFQRGLASVLSVADDTAWTDSFLATDDEAIQMGRIVWTETVKGRPPFRTRLTFAFDWRKEADGDWRIARDINYETVLK